MYVFLVLYIIFAFYYENILSKNWRKKIYQKYVNKGENTFIHCSRLTVVRVYVNVFSLKSTQRVVNGIKLGSNQTMTYKHATEYSKLDVK